MKLLRKFFVLFLLGIFFGCISMLEPAITPTPPNVTPSCRTVITQQPYTESVCQNVSKMEEVCITRDLNYSLSETNRTYLCVEEKLCVNYYPNGTCANYYCSKGMTRCKLSLKNLDTQKSGTWSVSANFTLDGSTFKKEAANKTILPLESDVFDFTQFYDLDLNQKKAECNIFVEKPARLQDCSFITKISEECSNETKYKEVEQKICE